MANLSQNDFSLNDFQNLSEVDENNSIDSDTLIQRIDNQLSENGSKNKNKEKIFNKQLSILPMQSFPVQNNPQQTFQTKDTPQTIMSQNILDLDLQPINLNDNKNNISRDSNKKQFQLIQESSVQQLVFQSSKQSSKFNDDRNFFSLLNNQNECLKSPIYKKSTAEQATQTPTKDSDPSGFIKSEFKVGKVNNKIKINQDQSPNLLQQLIDDCRSRITSGNNKITTANILDVKKSSLKFKSIEQSPRFKFDELKKSRQASPITFLDKKSVEVFIDDIKFYQKSQRNITKKKNLVEGFDSTLKISRSPFKNYTNKFQQTERLIFSEFMRQDNVQATRQPDTQICRSRSRNLQSATKNINLSPRKPQKVAQWNDIFRKIEYEARERSQKHMDQQTKFITPSVQHIFPKIIVQKQEYNSPYINPALKALYEQSKRYLKMKN